MLMAFTYACPNDAQTHADSLQGLSAAPFYDCAVWFFFSFFLISNTLDSTYNLMGNLKATLMESSFRYKVKMGPIIVLIDFFPPL